MRGRASCSAPTSGDRVVSGYRVGAGATAADGDGAGEPPTTNGRFAHAESPVRSVISASPSTTDFTCVFIAILLLSENTLSSRFALLPGLRVHAGCQPPNHLRIEGLEAVSAYCGPCG